MDETKQADSLSHKGLTDFGRQVIKRMNELGVIVDLSHTGEQTFYDAIAKPQNRFYFRIVLFGIFARYSEM